jgi:hypothetical protein
MVLKHFALTASNGTDMRAEISTFATQIGLERAASERYSIVFLLGLYGGLKAGLLNPHKVVHEINVLEGIQSTSTLKPPTQFRRPPLRGLWHKHYLEDGLHSVAQNVKNGIDKDGLPLFEDRMREAELSGQIRYVTVDDIPLLAADAVGGTLKRRMAAGEMTGEWIVYARHEDRNYYLCLGTHDKTQHDYLRKLIDSYCCVEFPFLSSLLATPK